MSIKDLNKRVSAARKATEDRGETFYPGASRVHLAAFPPKERWDHWTELDSKAWPERVEKRYMLVPTTCFNCESACGLLAYIDKDSFEKNDIHIHVPAGAVPKDGPSAGVTLLTSLVSLLTGRCVRDDVAMTGEITLRGQVLPVGGIKDKVLAALRSGIKKIILPERNRKDIPDIPEDVREQLEFTFCSQMSEVLDVALRK